MNPFFDRGVVELWFRASRRCAIDQSATLAAALV
jgi:hypothetical protein